MAKAKSFFKSGGNPRQRFIARLAKIFHVGKDEAERLGSVKLKSSIRLNRLSPQSAEDTLSQLQALGAELEPIPWCPDAYYLKSEKGQVVESRLFLDGHIYVQNASSLIPALVLDPQPGERILDVCAAPGGKTAHMAQLSGGQAEILANDALREAKLKDVLSTFHVPHAGTCAFPGQFIDRHVEGAFDRILLDAQCSGEGMMNISQGSALKFWSEERIQKMAYLQQKMITAAWKVLKPGGVLVYSTCTFGPEENEAPIARHLKHHADASIEPIDLDIEGRLAGLTSWDGQNFPDSLQNALRIRPSEYMEGFFVCRVRKGEG